MEDLSNYEMVHRSIGLDQAHIEEGLAWLGKFHAASMVYREKNGDYGKEFEFGVYAPFMEPTYQPYYDGYFDHYLKALKALPNGDEIAEKTEKVRGRLYSVICNALSHNQNAFNVLCHGMEFQFPIDFLSNSLIRRHVEQQLDVSSR
jgi:hypothetical protein